MSGLFGVRHHNIDTSANKAGALASVGSEQELTDVFTRNYNKGYNAAAVVDYSRYGRRWDKGALFLPRSQGKLDRLSSCPD